MMSPKLFKAVVLLCMSQIPTSSGLVIPKHSATKQALLSTRCIRVNNHSSRQDECDGDSKFQNDDNYSNRRRILLSNFKTAVGSVLGLGGGLVVSSSNTAQAMDFGGMVNFGSTNGNGNNPSGSGGNKKRLGGLANKIRGICQDMDELQRDLMQERWDLVVTYPPQLRSYVPVFTTYTDAAFPSELPSDWGLRVALRYEVGRFFASLERFKRAAERHALNEAYIAYSDMSLHLDRYLRVGGLYTYYDSTIDNEQFFEGYLDSIVHSNPKKDPAEVRDLIVLVKGPDTGKTGIVIGIYPSDDNKNLLCVVKLDKIRGMREIRVVPLLWAAKRLGEQDPDDVFLIPREKKRLSMSNGQR